MATATASTIARSARSSARIAWVLLHRYAGLCMALFLVWAGITGVALAFYKELDRALNPELYRVVERAQAPLDADALADDVRAVYPHAFINVLALDRRAGESVRMRLTPLTDPASDKPYPLSLTEIFVDPVDGRVLGGREWGVFAADRAHLLPFLYKAHYTLYAGKIGEWFMGVVALIWALDCFVGFYLTLPRAGTARRGWWQRWREAWRIKRGASAVRFNFDLHRAGGLWLWIVLFALAFTGVYFNLKNELFRPAVNAFSPLSEEAAVELKTVPQAQQPLRLSFADAIARGYELRSATARDWQLSYVGRQPEAPGIYRVRFAEYGRGDVSWRFRYENLYIDGATGALLKTVAYDQGSAGDRFILWQYPLHSGFVFGFWGRVLIAVAGVAAVVLSITGVLIWWRKRRRT